MPLTIESESVRTYMPIIQGVINRMATNSASCKTWCVTIVSALMVLALGNNKPNALYVGFLPLGLFFLLDAYYLSLERDFIHIHKEFLEKLEAGTAANKDVYKLAPASGFGHRLGSLISAFFSASILPFYGVLAIALYVTRRNL